MCLSPLHISRKLSTGQVLERVVPCGSCPECLKKRQSSIVVRSYIESSKYPKVCMFTLTYNESALPHTDDGEVTLRREDIKNWKKEFRKLISNKDFSWILSGEYSPRGFHRPHYHGIFFGLDKSDLSIIQNCWEERYGFTVFKIVPSANQKDLLNVSRYISKYVVKDIEFRSPSLSVEQPRLMSSIGFGFPDDNFWNYLLCFDKFVYDPFDSELLTLEIAEAVCGRMYFTIDGFKYSIPNYAIRKKLYYKTSSGVLRQSPLLRLVSFVKRFRSSNVRYSEFRQFCSRFPERTVYQNLVEFENLQELSNYEKSNFERENIISTYKKSLI